MLTIMLAPIKLSDFGLAISGENSNKANVKLSGKHTFKSSFDALGVILLELLMGRRHVERVAEAQCQCKVTWLTEISKLANIVDATIKNSIHLNHLYQLFYVYNSSQVTDHCARRSWRLATIYE